MRKRDFLRIYRKILRRPLTITAILFLLSSFLSLQPNEGLVLGEFVDLSSNQQFNNLQLPAPTFLFNQNKIPEGITAKSVFVFEETTHTTIFAQNANDRLAPASLTKIASALVVLAKMDLNQIVTVPEDINEKAQGSLMGLVPGEKIKVENLLWGMLLASGNDASYTLAMNFPAGYEGFIEEMNELSSFLRLKNTHFTNPTGFDEKEHFTSSYDLALLSAFALRNSFFAQIVSTTEKTVVSEPFSSLTTNHKLPTTHQQWHNLANTNELLGKIKGVNGIKTGYTDAAGECMIVSLNFGDGNVIIVLLGSENRLKDAEVLIDWIKEDSRIILDFEFTCFLWENMI